MVWPKTNDTLRWEWRTFSPSLADLEAKIGSAVRIAPCQSDEIYLLNSATPHSAKIRGAVLDVKRLVQVDPSGLELWSPAFKAAFPLAHFTVGVLGIGPATSHTPARSLYLGRVLGGDCRPQRDFPSSSGE